MRVPSAPNLGPREAGDQSAAVTLARRRDSTLTPPDTVRILHHMVKHGEPSLDRVFAALSDPTRRALLTRLAEQETASVSELAAPLPISLPAVMKHLNVLEQAGLVARRKTGRTVACRLTAAPMEDAMAWLTRYQRFWTESLDRLAALVEEKP
jgi:DNA-binding transcriptional ArsR family regulator